MNRNFEKLKDKINVSNSATPETLAAVTNEFSFRLSRRSTSFEHVLK